MQGVTASGYTRKMCFLMSGSDSNDLKSVSSTLIMLQQR